jgi:hypothetical protein
VCPVEGSIISILIFVSSMIRSICFTCLCG